ncbi:MAG: bifunctional diaminohydroxyphosphoribosylaminopyrimidine deaminase/5-amino-6-(5-phosphoribosylamino)uracil reductase RibD [Myxococcota bacterium]|nr:bifunctional diaminohydroxyphosphoribosylaminopyrimidine deaminase/5-amino-6-(5-phosphoribosylamino)uracil reductase RibD [Myxococcota bacterium]
MTQLASAESTALDQHAMEAALRAAVVGLGAASPNPAVGAVVLAEGVTVAAAGHRRAGEQHAETLALEQAGEAAHGASVYVTLEPCHHRGRQPACSAALIRAGVAEVVYGIDDPDARVAGRGAQALRDAGITVRSGVMADACLALNPGYLTRQRLGRPRIVLKTAVTLEGAAATSAGESQWITGPAARRLVHELRGRMASVLVGAETARRDAVRLNVRFDGQPPWWYQSQHAPHRLVATQSGAAPAPRGGGGPKWLVGGSRLADGFDAHIANDGDWSSTLKNLADRGVNEVLCEGGSGLAASLLTAGVVDEWIQMVAPMSLSGSGLPVLRGQGVERLEQARRGRLAHLAQLGQDAVLWTVFDDHPSFADQADWLNRLEPK